jgi:hypothetical protein
LNHPLSQHDQAFESTRRRYLFGYAATCDLNLLESAEISSAIMYYASLLVRSHIALLHLGATRVIESELAVSALSDVPAKNAVIDAADASVVIPLQSTR